MVSYIYNLEQLSHMYNLEPFIFKREVKTIDPIMQSNFLVLIKRKKKKLHKEMFHLIEMSLISKRKMTEVTVKCLCAKFGQKNYSLSILVLQCA